MEFFFPPFTTVNESTRITETSSKKAWQYDNLTIKPYHMRLNNHLQRSYDNQGNCHSWFTI